jgi:hypothetical protein
MAPSMTPRFLQTSQVFLAQPAENSDCLTQWDEKLRGLAFHFFVRGSPRPRDAPRNGQIIRKNSNFGRTEREPLGLAAVSRCELDRVPAETLSRRTRKAHYWKTHLDSLAECQLATSRQTLPIATGVLSCGQRGGQVRCQARASFSEDSTSSMVTPVTRPTIVASAG